MSFKLNKVVEIHWFDAGGSAPWQSIEEATEETHIVPVKSVGYLLKKDKVEVVIVLGQSLDGEVMHTLAIPIGWVAKIRNLK